MKWLLEWLRWVLNWLEGWLPRKYVKTEVEIAAPISVVWNTLTDWSSWSEWNPILKDASVVPQAGPGATLLFAVHDGGNVSKRSANLVTVDAPKELTWATGSKLLMHSFHYWRLEPTASGGTKLSHGDDWTGLLLAPEGVRKMVQEGFEKINAGLKERCEAATATAKQ